MLKKEKTIKKTARAFIFGLFSFICFSATAQYAEIQGVVVDQQSSVAFANVYLEGTAFGTSSDDDGNYLLERIPQGKYLLKATILGYREFSKIISVEANEKLRVTIRLQPTVQQLEETVVTGTLKAVSRSDSPVPVEVYSPAFLKQNPTASIFEALQNVNGVRPQINCNVCNTGDIHINGLEGPYTLVLIDGMPIVSGLGTVYGLSGIPNALIDQIEIVKGPASSLYGSEAVGGLINIITKNTVEAPHFTADAFVTGWGEYNLDIGTKFGLGKKTDVLLGINYFNFDQLVDNNGDNFTDLTLQDRISVFQKWNFQRKHNRIFSLAGRLFNEDRWGGELQWTPEYRGGDQVYGESIYTRRWEILGKYQLPINEKLLLTFSYNDHAQNSVYGDIPYIADQRIGFTQLTWDKKLQNHDLLLGSALRYNYYNDNTTATPTADEVTIPSLFVQDELQLAEKHSLLLGIRFDYDKRHGTIFTPRTAYRYKISDTDILRFNAGTGFRAVNLFTEEHAALTGARDVVVIEELKPERSFNLNLNYLKKIYADNGTYATLDASLFYTNFSNAILPDYDSDPNKIIYDNLKGKSVSKGLSANADVVFPSGFKFTLGATFQDVSQTENGVSSRQILTESYTGTWNVGYKVKRIKLNLDYNGNLYGPMRLPTLGENDPRSEYSPVWSIQNVQFTWKGLANFEFYGGIKNLLNW
ncbi:MAG: TonB-dependent receptor, partial [Flavobacteriaceae bacterium]